MLTPQIESALNKMILLENSVSRLYTLYAERFPSHGGLWTILANEETEHADWITKLTEQARAGKMEIAANRFKAEAVQMMLNSLGTYMAEAGSGNPPLLKCLSISMTLETALIEKDFFRIFQTDSSELRTVMNRLTAATENHQRMVKQAWQKAREDAGI